MFRAERIWTIIVYMHAFYAITVLSRIYLFNYFGRVVNLILN